MMHGQKNIKLCGKIFVHKKRIKDSIQHRGFW